MKNESNSPWGAMIERGKITAAEADGYTVESFDRPGATGFGLSGPNGLAVGDIVYFFLFSDGKGMVLSGAED